MAKLNIKNLNKDYQAIKVLKNINIDIIDGEFVVLVGPSGCGKSTLLRTIAGLEEVTSGEIQIKDKVVNNIDPAERGVAMVFQSYALYPHMNVAENMSFGLKMAKKPKAFIEERVNSAAKILKIEPLLDRKPKQLSGGQRQRVAIGRAIVREPEVFLFDEPLSNLDAELRVQMRIELVKLHERLKSTMIYVTHDQVEAMTMADKIVVLKDGCVEQIGSPDDLYQLPRNLFVASFIGSPKMNFFKSKISGQTKGETEITEDSGDVTKFKIPVGFDPEGDKKIGLNHLKDQAVGTQVTLGVRPEHIRLEKEKGFSSIKLTTVISEVLGSTTHVHCKTASSEDVIVEVRGNPHLKNGESIVGYFDPSYIYLFETKDKCNRLKQK